jgi:alpha-L-fucosidase 2
MEGGGTYPNLFCAHPHFQIDGNFGATAGIAEMLVQSHAGEIHLLPALPQAWHSGKVKGLKTRGGFEIDMEWKQGKLTKAVVYSTIGGNCRIRTNERMIIENVKAKTAKNENQNALFSFVKAGEPLIKDKSKLIEMPDIQGFVIYFPIEKGEKYIIK